MTRGQDQPGAWLAGIYERNALGGVWAGFEILARGTTVFRSREHACSALRIQFDGDSFATEDPRTVRRARRRLPRVMLINPRHDSGTLTLFVHHAPHLDKAALMTFAVSDSARSIQDMAGALVPAAGADEARASLAAAISAARENPERDSAEQFMEKAFEVDPDPVGPAADRAAETLATLTGDFRGFWSAYVGNTCLGLLHAACWAAAR